MLEPDLFGVRRDLGLTVGQVSAVVVNYNSGELLGPCLESLRSAGVDEIVVADNASSDGSEQATGSVVPGARLVRTGSNLGYGRAANQAAELTDRPYLLVCNPDLVVDSGAIGVLVDRMESDPALGIVGPQLVNPDGSVYPSARAFPDLIDAVGHGLVGMVWPANPWSRRYKLLDWDHSDARGVDWVSGACFLVRRRVWEELSGFDPAYFMYLEDVDLCWRASRLGWVVAYEPRARVMHVQGVSSDQHPYRMILAHHESLWRFGRQSTVGRARLVLPVVAVGLLLRVLVAVVHRLLGRQAVQQTVGQEVH